MKLQILVPVVFLLESNASENTETGLSTFISRMKEISHQNAKIKSKSSRKRGKSEKERKRKEKQHKKELKKEENFSFGESEERKCEKCDPHALCLKENGDFTCSCISGFRGNGYVCEDIDECDEMLLQCPLNYECINTVGTARCSCPAGFAKVGKRSQCKDINECKLGTQNCYPGARCSNTDGSYECTCPKGMEADFDSTFTDFAGLTSGLYQQSSAANLRSVASPIEYKNGMVPASKCYQCCNTNDNCNHQWQPNAESDWKANYVW